jgi:hypothetical protein
LYRQEGKHLPFTALLPPFVPDLSISTFDDVSYAATVVTKLLPCARMQKLSMYDYPEFQIHLKYFCRLTAVLTTRSFFLALPYIKNDPFLQQRVRARTTILAFSPREAGSHGGASSCPYCNDWVKLTSVEKGFV